MADADTVLAAMSESDAVTASDSLDYVLDEDLRVIAIPARGVVLGVVGDKDTNAVRFAMPSVYKGVDLSKFECRVSYINAHGDTGFYQVKDLAPDGDRMTFTWLVSDSAVAYEGDVTFAVNFRELSGTTVTRAYNSTIATATSLVGIQTPTSMPASVYEDFIAHMVAEFDKQTKDSIGAAKTATSAANTAADNANKAATSAAKSANDAAASATSAAKSANDAASTATNGEKSRVTAESARVAAESARASAETDRESNYDTKMTEWQTKVDGMAMDTLRLSIVDGKLCQTYRKRA